MQHNPEFYLDNAATTALDPEALEAALPLLGAAYGNPSSLHPLGMEANRAVKSARERLARLLGVPPQAILFTSGATEANNLALQGAFGPDRTGGPRGGRLLISAIEHPSVAETAQALAARGVTVQHLPVTPAGIVDLERAAPLIGEDLRMLSCMAVNNELGTVQPIVALGRLLRERAPKALFHVDAVQGFTKMPLPWREAGAHLLSVSAHKVHGPKGAGALVQCRPAVLLPLLHGGQQERGLRSGTENPFAIAAFALAAECSAAQHSAQAEERRAYWGAWVEFLGEFPRLRVFRSAHATPFVLNFHMAPIPGEVVLHHLEREGLMVSTGSACSTRKRTPSHVLLALGQSPQQALSSVRLSFSLHNTLAGLVQVFPAFRRAMSALERV